MAFTEFYMQNGGSNLNAGSTNNNTAAYTSTNGNWNGSSTFTPSDTQSASLVSVGDFASVYNDGATTGVYFARVTTVNSTGGNITSIVLSTTVKYGSAPTSSATGRSIKIGGAWAGPGGAATFPFGLSGSIGTLQNASTDFTRLNAKNDQTYTMTSQLALGSLGFAILQGYSSTPGDGGKATFTSNVTTATNFTVATSGNQTFIDLIFASTGGSNANHVLSTTIGDITFFRCVFHGGRGSGLDNSANGHPVYVVECEAYDNNKSNTTSVAGFSAQGTSALICISCYSHDNSGGSNSHGYSEYSSGAGLVLINSIADTNAGNGAALVIGSAGRFISWNSDYYNNTGDAIKFSAGGQYALIVNNNFIKNGGKGVNATTAPQSGILYNNGRGAGTQANGSSDTLKSIVNTSTDVTYASNITPWNAPSTGDFKIVLATAQSAGRGVFTETDGTNTGTVGYPDIGAAQSLITAGGKSSHVFAG